MPDGTRPARPVSVEVRAHPRASRDAIGPYRDGVLHMRTVRPPTDGEANVALGRLLARALDVPPSRVRLVSGERGRNKRFEIDGLEDGALAARLTAIGGSD